MKHYFRDGTEHKGGTHKMPNGQLHSGKTHTKTSVMAKIDKSKMACNKPKRQVSGGKKFVVKACQNGKEKIIRFGDANMKIKKNQPGRRKNFRARHGCDTRPPSKMTARYWSCKKW